MFQHPGQGLAHGRPLENVCREKERREGGEEGRKEGGGRRREEGGGRRQTHLQHHRESHSSTIAFTTALLHTTHQILSQLHTSHSITNTQSQTLCDNHI